MLGKSTDDLEIPTYGKLSAGMVDVLGVVVGELDDPKFGAQDEITGSLKSTVASEMTDVGVTF